jgi:large subunit ribosomal protein L5
MAMSTLQERMENAIAPQLAEALGIRNRYGIPRLRKIVINMGIGIGSEKDTIKACTADLAAIAGQRPVVTHAHKSISNFKLREGMPIGAKVTLRGKRMYDFLTRLVDGALPRIRDFRGISPKGFDGRGNYTLGIKEQSIFPEIDPNTIVVSQGMDITFVTSARDDKGAFELLKRLGMPFAEA